jgi:2-methylisocitrate lyase-like PEP mutase family enzyme
MPTTQQERARAFHELHGGGRILVLPNAWDAASARIFELAGARAVATSSAGLANAQGYPDGEKIPLDLLLTVVRRICETVDVPVTVDLEAGYGTNGPEVTRSIEAVLDSGAIGVNVEDRMLDPAVLTEKIAASLEVSGRKNVALFVNARTDVYLRRAESPDEQFAEAVRRLRAYESAGAHGLFAPGLADPGTISRLLREIGLPLNVMAFPGVPPAKELERLGVARVSAGGGPMRAVMSLVGRIATELLVEGTYGFAADAMANGEANAMFVRR